MWADSLRAHGRLYLLPPYFLGLYFPLYKMGGGSQWACETLESFREF
jgi:hypothetical protein